MIQAIEDRYRKVQGFGSGLMSSSGGGGGLWSLSWSELLKKLWRAVLDGTEAHSGNRPEN
jgi:hypothetical protein